MWSMNFLLERKNFLIVYKSKGKYFDQIKIMNVETWKSLTISMKDLKCTPKLPLKKRKVRIA